MISRAPPADSPPARHRLVRVVRDAWPAVLAAHGLAHEPLLHDWAARGRPLIVRRPAPGERGLALGLPLPPSAGKRRIAVTVRASQIASIEPPPNLDAVAPAAPPAWQPCLRALAALAARHAVDCRVFGSLAWQALTGLPYLGAASDLDILLTLPAERHALTALLDGLAALDARAPMRIDGELVRADGAGVNWRELQTGMGEVAVKTATEVVLCAPDAFLEVSR
ncbi:malonate decarboxylase holo-[acyl-carrier-protein] synthase [Burkholderia alba]|uniref:malonate decarboxylase holo-[acyl-carrier-protein] synthase n=1 Tax=Burkholderia alba TaxID=2683677 RepID=UPI002B051DE6|nr:malonate decarboxylase holo-[acyl-carrier-protein] synthase [Burkholderia alba]